MRAALPYPSSFTSHLQPLLLLRLRLVKSHTHILWQGRPQSSAVAGGMVQGLVGTISEGGRVGTATEAKVCTGPVSLVKFRC